MLFILFIYINIKDIVSSNQLKLVACGGELKLTQDIPYLLHLKKCNWYEYLSEFGRPHRIALPTMIVA